MSSRHANTLVILGIVLPIAFVLLVAISVYLYYRYRYPYAKLNHSNPEDNQNNNINDLDLVNLYREIMEVPYYAVSHNNYSNKQEFLDEQSIKVIPFDKCLIKTNTYMYVQYKDKYIYMCI